MIQKRGAYTLHYDKSPWPKSIDQGLLSSDGINNRIEYELQGKGRTGMFCRPFIANDAFRKVNLPAAEVAFVKT